MSHVHVWHGVCCWWCRNLRLWGGRTCHHWRVSPGGKWRQCDGSLPVTVWCDVLLLTTPRRWAAWYAGPYLWLESPVRHYRRGFYWLCGFKDSVCRWNLWFSSAGVFAEVLAGRATGTQITFPPLSNADRRRRQTPVRQATHDSRLQRQLPRSFRVSVPSRSIQPRGSGSHTLCVVRSMKRTVGLVRWRSWYSTSEKFNSRVRDSLTFLIFNVHFLFACSQERCSVL